MQAEQYISKLRKENKEKRRELAACISVSNQQFYALVKRNVVG